MAPEIMAIATVASAVMGYKAQKEQGQATSQLREAEAQLKEEEAEQIKEVSEHEERQMRTEGRRLKARQLLQFASGGVVPTTGTPLKVRERTAEEIERDIHLKKYGYGIQIGKKKKEAKLQRAMGYQATRAARYQAGTSLLTGAYRVASIYN